jgi:hypothetical protein
VICDARGIPLAVALTGGHRNVLTVAHVTRLPKTRYTG